jgi:hypothetical protein
VFVSITEVLLVKILRLETFICLPVVGKEGWDKCFLIEEILIAQFVLKCYLFITWNGFGKVFDGKFTQF